MTQPVNGTSTPRTPQETSGAARATQGYFEVGGQKLTFQDLVVLMGIISLEAQDKTFETMFNEAQERTNFMNKLNDAIQMLNKYKNNFDKDGNVKDKGGYTGGDDKAVAFTAEDMKIWKEEYYPMLVVSGLVQDGDWSQADTTLGVGSDGVFKKEELDTFLENANLAQTNLSSTNEQQMIRTNQAANKRATILQQLQTLLSSSKEGMSSAAR